MPELIPFRWPAEWKDSSKLDILKGTPINCIVGAVPPPFPCGEIRFIKLDGDRPPEGVAVREGVWPRTLLATKKDTAGAGPTGGPWVDSNAWVIRLAHTMEPGKSVWVSYTPPGGNEIVPLDSFVKPIAEAEAYGGHWIVALDRNFVQALDSRTDQALREWKRMVSAMKFFEARREWRSWEPVAALAVVSTFEGEGKLMSEEFLNLAPRHYLAYRALRAVDVPKASFEKQRAIIYLENDPPEGEVRTKLIEFARAGGLLICPLRTVDTAPDETRMDHSIRRFGKGRIAMPLFKWEDPFVLVDQVHVLLGFREDVVQVWNANDIDAYCLANPKNDKAVANLVPYASGQTPQIVLGFRKSYRSARLCTLDSEIPIKPVKGRLGIEIPLGEFTDYAALVLEA